MCERLGRSESDAKGEKEKTLKADFEGVQQRLLFKIDSGESRKICSLSEAPNPHSKARSYS